MKKRTILIMMALLLIPIAALAFTPKEWMRVDTGNSGDQVISTVPGYMYGIIVHTNGSSADLINMYDSSGDNSKGLKLIADWVITTSSTDRTQSISYDPPVAYEFGARVDVSSAGVLTYDVYYRNSDD